MLERSYLSVDPGKALGVGDRTLKQHLSGGLIFAPREGPNKDDGSHATHPNETTVLIIMSINDIKFNINMLGTDSIRIS